MVALLIVCTQAHLRSLLNHATGGLVLHSIYSTPHICPGTGLNPELTHGLQVCLLDLEYNLPVQVRDTAMTEEGAEVAALPGSDVGKEYALQRMTEDGTLGAAFAKQQANDTILRLQRTGPYYKVRLAGRQAGRFVGVQAGVWADGKAGIWNREN